MQWKPISEADLIDQINLGWERMTPPERYFWETVCIQQQKWRCSPWGDKGEGFWVVAILGTTVVWYNDIEDGFNCSTYQTFGEFPDYWCNQDGLDEVVRVLKGNLEFGRSDLWQASPPRAEES